jgi:hypothetical protein
MTIGHLLSKLPNRSFEIMRCELGDYGRPSIKSSGGTTNQVVIDLSGFSKGMQRFEKECKQAQ